MLSLPVLLSQGRDLNLSFSVKCQSSLTLKAGTAIRNRIIQNDTTNLSISHHPHSALNRKFQGKVARETSTPLTSVLSQLFPRFCC